MILSLSNSIYIFHDIDDFIIYVYIAIFYVPQYITTEL